MYHKIYLLLLCALNSHHGQRCLLNTRQHFGEPLPIILRDGRILEPNDNDGNIHLNHGDILTLSCESTGFIQHPNVKQQLVTGTISCAGGDNFINDQWLNSPARFTMFSCSDSPAHYSRRTDRSCYEGHPIIEVGYTVENIFYPVYESCFNEITLNPIYSKYTQKPYNAMFQTRINRPYFKDDNHYGDLPVNSLFSPAGLRGAIANSIGSLVDTYVTKNQMLSRGHLAAKTDFVFAFTERATFHYVNCAPQWTGFNGGNWNTLEVDLRNHIHNAGYNTTIYTGTFGVAQLLNQQGAPVNLYLNTDRNNNRVIPVPQYFYKVVYEPNTLRGIAYIGINNPYYSYNEARELFFCQDICRNNQNFAWLSWHPDNPVEGYTFCCTIQEFRETVHHLPNFETRGILY